MSNGTWTRWVISGVRTLLLIHHANALLHLNDEMWDGMDGNEEGEEAKSRSTKELWEVEGRAH